MIVNKINDVLEIGQGLPTTVSFRSCKMSEINYKNENNI